MKLTSENVAYHRSWRPASGRSGGWRVVRYPGANTTGLGHMQQHLSTTGRVVLYRTFAGAERKAIELNARQSSSQVAA